MKSYNQRLNLPNINNNKNSISNNKNILVFDQKNDIAGIAFLDEDLIIKPKVVFNAIG